MAILISGIRIALDQKEEDALAKALRKLRVGRAQVRQAYVTKTSLDARRRDRISLVNTVCVELFEGELEAVKTASDSSVVYREKKELSFPIGKEKLDAPIVIAGFGPAGMFAALVLAQRGYRPIVLERGADVDRRVEAVERFWTGRGFDPATNVQFGEGGAGTFSDGKLTTRISDPLCSIVLDEFVRHGAPEEIRKKAKPHIGTDRLRGIVKSIRQEIQTLGGQVRFDCQLESIKMEGNRLRSVTAGSEEIPASALILAVGHSARDTFEMLSSHPFTLQPKVFSVGARIEHLQSEIDRGLYGEHAGHPLLPKGGIPAFPPGGRQRGVYLLHVPRRVCRAVKLRGGDGCHQRYERVRAGWTQRQRGACRQRLPRGLRAPSFGRTPVPTATGTDRVCSCGKKLSRPSRNSRPVSQGRDWL